MRPVTDPAILAQLNGGQQGGASQGAPAGLRPVEDPAILAQLNGGNAQTQPQAEAPRESGGFLQKMFSPMAHVAAGLATSGRNTLNNLQDAGKSTGIDAVMGKIPGTKDITRPSGDRTFDYYKGMGLDENAADKVAVAGLDFAPYMMGASGAVKAGSKLLSESPKLAEKAAAFASKNPYTSKFLTNMAENAPAGAAFTAANKGDQKESLLASTAVSALPVAIQPLVKYGAQKYAQSAIPAFTKKATEKLKELLPSGDYAKTLSDKYLSAVGKNKANWKALEKTAEGLDKSLISPLKEEGKLIQVKGGNKIQNEVENTDRMGNPLNPQFVGRDSSNFPANIKPEIVGYDAGGAPIMKQPPHDFSATQKDIPLTRKVSGNEARNTPASVGQYDASGAPLFRNGIDFKNSPYDSYIESFKNKVGAMEPAKQQEYTQALKLADKAQKMAPRSFDGVVSLRKNINQDMKEYLNNQSGGITPQNSKSKQFLSGLKENLKNDVLDANTDKIGAEALTGFKSQWETANKSHQDLQGFNKALQPGSGIVKPTRQMRERFENVKSGNELDESVLGKYAPSLTPTGAKGIEGIKHLEKLMGDKTAARDAIKAHIFNKQIGDGSVTVDAAARYAKLSSAQKKRLFGRSDEGQYLEAINKTRLAFGREPEKTLAKIGHGITSLGIPGGIGFAGALASGDSWDKSLMYGIATAAASKGIKGLAGKTATANSVNRAIELGQYGKPMSGRYLNAVGQNFINQRKDSQ